MVRLRSQDFNWREVEGEVVAIDMRSSRYMAANRSATFLWPLLVEGTTREELVALLVKRTGIDPRRATADIEAFLRPLAEAGLLAAEP